MDRIEFEEQAREFLAERDYELERLLDDQERHKELGLDTLVDEEGWIRLSQRLLQIRHRGEAATRPH